MPNTASARRNRRLTNLRRHHIHLQKAKASLEGTRLLARALPYSPAFAIAEIAGDDTNIMNMNIDPIQTTDLHQRIELPGHPARVAQAAAGPFQFSGCFDWREVAPMQEKGAPFAYIFTPTVHENLCAAAQHLQQASALVQAAINASRCSSSEFSGCFLTF